MPVSLVAKEKPNVMENDLAVVDACIRALDATMATGKAGGSASTISDNATPISTEG